MACRSLSRKVRVRLGRTYCRTPSLGLKYALPRERKPAPNDVRVKLFIALAVRFTPAPGGKYCALTSPLRM
eukprot:766177-Hanusia_phi.AAC.3